MDLDGLKADAPAGIERWTIRTVRSTQRKPSPFSHEILNANPYAYLDDAPLEERRDTSGTDAAFAGRGFGEIGALDPLAIGEVRSESWPVVRNADELHDALLTLFAVPPDSDLQSYFDELVESCRATTMRTGCGRFWVPAERLTTVQQALPGCQTRTFHRIFRDRRS